MKRAGEEISDPEISVPTPSTKHMKVPETRLSTLPAEILLMIFKHLSVRDLNSILRFCDHRLKEIILSNPKVDFSICNTMRPGEVSCFFTEDRTLYLREINLNHVFFVKSSVLETYLSKCKHLVKLAVYECGLTYTNILSILRSCKELEELYWSVLTKRSSRELYYTNDMYRNLKKIYLTLGNKGVFHQKVVFDLLSRCGFAEEIVLNLSGSFMMSLSSCMGQNTIVAKLINETEWPLFIVFKDYFSDCKRPAAELIKLLTKEKPLNIRRNMSCRFSTFQFTNMMTDECNCSDPDVRVQLCVLWTHMDENRPRLSTANVRQYHAVIEEADQNVFGPKDLPFYVTNYSSHLQIMCDSAHLAEIPSLPADSVHSLVLFLQQESSSALLGYMQTLLQITGKKLTHFTVHNTSFPSFPQQILSVNEDVICEVLPKITSTCLSIQVLNLSDIHFEEPFLFNALYCLKRLKTLSLAACCISSSKEDSVAERGNFRDLVSHCKNVEHFFLYKCTCRKGPSDEEMNVIHGWKKLSHLLIKGVQTFRTCQFLSDVSKFCPHLASLELIEVGPPVVCHFTPNVIKILRKCKQMMFLRINHRSFFPNTPLFWKSLAMCKNLQGLCMSFRYQIDRVVSIAIEQLPLLHVFHIIGEGQTDSSLCKVRKALSENGIENINIESEQDMYECKSPHFFTL